MIALIVILTVFLALALLRVGIQAEYGVNGAKVLAIIGPFHLGLYPLKEKRREKEKKPKKPKKKKDQPEKKEGGALDGFQKLIPAALDMAGRFRRKLVINQLTLYYTAASDDAAKAAIAYGRAWAAIGALTPVLENAFNIKNRDIQAAVDFNIRKPVIYFKAAFTLAIWETFYITAGFAYQTIKIILSNRRKKQNKDGATNGTSN